MEEMKLYRFQEGKFSWEYKCKVWVIFRFKKKKQKVL